MMCMRTNIVLNNDLVQEAMQYSHARTRRALVEEALATYVAVEGRRTAARDVSRAAPRAGDEARGDYGFASDPPSCSGADRERV